MYIATQILDIVLKLIKRITVWNRYICTMSGECVWIELRFHDSLHSALEMRDADVGTDGVFFTQSSDSGLKSLTNIHAHSLTFACTHIAY